VAVSADTAGAHVGASEIPAKRECRESGGPGFETRSGVIPQPAGVALGSVAMTLWQWLNIKLAGESVPSSEGGPTVTM
jgi:hypothetical protein